MYSQMYGRGFLLHKRPINAQQLKKNDVNKSIYD